jgi:hypothetical protein
MMDTFEREHRAGEVKIGIYCLSEIVDSTLMWSHYADSHRGICVVLEAEQISENWFMDFARSSFNFAGMALAKVSAEGQIKVIKRTLSTEEKIAVLPVHKVLYSNQIPGLVMYDPLPGGPMRGMTFEFVKHTAWSYERERRVVVRESFLAENPAHLSCDAIAGVVFGLKVSKFDALRVQAAINDRTDARSVAYSRMVERPDGFGLDRVPVTDFDSFIYSLQ